MSRFRFAVLLVFVNCSLSFAADPQPGESWFVSTETLILQKSPSGLSPAVKTLKYGDPVTVEDLLLVSVGQAEYPDDKFATTNILPRWILASFGGEKGYLPVSSMASKWLIRNQDPNGAISGADAGVAQKGFSESEDDMDLASMRGAAGSAKTGTADAGAVQRMLDELAPAPESCFSEILTPGQIQSADEVLKELSLASEAPGKTGSLWKKSKQLGATGLKFGAKISGEVAGEDKNVAMASKAGEIAGDMLYSEIGAVQEFQLGKVVSSKILPSYKLLPYDHIVTRYMNLLGGALAAASCDPTPYKGYRFVVLDDDEVNAFAAPGGFVFITTGMLRFLEDEDEMAAILAHEIAHVELRHGIQAVGKEKVLKLFSMAKELAEDQSGAGQAGQGSIEKQIATLADEIFSKMMSSIRQGYSVEIESEADWRSIQLSRVLGYDTTVLYNVLERFKEQKGSYGGANYPRERGADAVLYQKRFDPNYQPADRTARTKRYKEFLTLLPAGSGAAGL